MMGRGVATIAAFAASALLTFYLSQRVFPVRYEPRRLTLLLGTAVAMTGLAWSLPAEIWMAPLKLLLLALTPVVLWLTGDFREEAQELGELVRAARQPLSAWWRRSMA